MSVDAENKREFYDFDDLKPIKEILQDKPSTAFFLTIIRSLLINPHYEVFIPTNDLQCLHAPGSPAIQSYLQITLPIICLLDFKELSAVLTHEDSEVWQDKLLTIMSEIYHLKKIGVSIFRKSHLGLDPDMHATPTEHIQSAQKKTSQDAISVPHNFHLYAFEALLNLATFFLRQKQAYHTPSNLKEYVYMIKSMDASLGAVHYLLMSQHAFNEAHILAFMHFAKDRLKDFEVLKRDWDDMHQRKRESSRKGGTRTGFTHCKSFTFEFAFEIWEQQRTQKKSFTNKSQMVRLVKKTFENRYNNRDIYPTPTDDTIRKYLDQIAEKHKFGPFKRGAQKK